MNPNERLQLDKIIKNNNVVDQTEMIRKLKHSKLLRKNINDLIILKTKYGDDNENLHLEAMIECNFLFTYYTEIYNKVRKDEIDLKILYDFLDVLEKIEEGKLDQHEGSFEIGTLLKKIYVDSALRKAAKINKQEDKEEFVKPHISISWKDYKKQINI
jgi:hypothetical protein